MDITSLTNANQATMQTELNKANNFAKSVERNLTGAAASGDDAGLLQACKDFESYFIQEMFKIMRNASESINPNGGLLGKSMAETTFIEMRDEEFARAAANSGGIGLASFMYKQIKRENDAKTENMIVN